MEVVVRKLKTLLEKLLHQEPRTPIDHNLRKLLTLLRHQEQESTLITEWIHKAVVKWSTSGLHLHPNVAAFVLDLVALLAKNEDRFCALNTSNFFIKLVNVAKARSSCDENVKLAYIGLLGAFLEHTSGIEWMIACNFWEDIYQMSLSNGSDDVVREGRLFVSKILEKTVDLDEGFCSGVVKKMMLPLGENIYKSIKASSDMRDVSEEVASRFLKPTLTLIGTSLEYFLEGIYFGEKDFSVVLVFLKNFHLEERISDFMIIAQARCLAFDIGKIMFVMQFLELYVKVATGSVNVATINATVRRMKNNYMVNVSKGTAESLMELSGFAQLLWNLIEAKIPPLQLKESKDCSFADELFLFLILPSYCLLLKFCWEKDKIEEILSDEFRDRFLYKVYGMMGQDTVRACYFWRDTIVPRPDIFQICTLANDRVRHTRKYFSKKAAIVAAQTYIYFLEDLVNSVKDFPRKLDPFLDELPHFEQVFQNLVMLFEEFHITWQDTLEATNVLTIAFDFLMINRWPTSIVVHVLTLINVATAKYMAPNLALLLDRTTDSTIALLGPLLFAKLHDEVPQVKRAAVEVVRTIAHMSSTKFPSLQKVLMDSELPTLVVKMSTCDGESFVRATAIKCLQEMIQVEEIWNNALKTEDLSQKMRDILLNETEGIVRVEAATFMCVAYEHQQFPKDSLDAIYETMIYSSTTDLHWEVKVRALNFWDKVIKNHLQNQGMIDGSFPNVTFSKEHRKIVTLTDSEIRKRLLKVLGQLSAIGCLGVLTAAIKDDCDMEVSKTAVKITQKLVDLLKKYAVGGECSGPTSPIPTESGMSMSSGISVDESMDSPRSSQPDLNEEIIEQIVNAKDASLLKGVYAPSDYGSVSNYDFQVRKIVTPTEFLQFTHQDLNNIIAEKKKWLNGIEDLGSLLDDMLKTYDEDVNSMDCY
ncbi:uncharacterized protein LOC135133272 isoform X8 [Zophobas morio]|uniref:uncharacterized protein LOC135133272 isoform X8 n=1 Tax=Zophobas morio TaxID=2755281 RepID=UPI00308349D9